MAEMGTMTPGRLEERELLRADRPLERQERRELGVEHIGRERVEVIGRHHLPGCDDLAHD
jgi:hypothetical protein